jgi:hypothetical protein
MVTFSVPMTSQEEMRKALGKLKEGGEVTNKSHAYKMWLIQIFDSLADVSEIAFSFKYSYIFFASSQLLFTFVRKFL